MLNADDLDSAADVDADLLRTTVQQLLDHRLVEHRRRRPPGGAVAGLAEPQQRRARGVAPLIDVGRFADRSQLVTHPARLENPAHLMVEMDRSRERVGLGPSLQHRHGAPELGEQDRERVADGAVADDRDVGVDVGVGVGAHADRRGWCPHTLIWL